MKVMHDRVAAIDVHKDMAAPRGALLYSRFSREESGGGVFPLFWTPDQAANWLSCLYPSSYSPGVKYPSAECLRTRL